MKKSTGQWAVLKPTKAPCLLQKAITLLNGYLLDIFRTSLATGLNPDPWKAAKVVFMPKTGKKDNLSRGYVNKRRGIFSDSQAPIKAISSYYVT